MSGSRNGEPARTAAGIKHIHVGLETGMTKNDSRPAGPYKGVIPLETIDPVRTTHEISPVN